MKKPKLNFLLDKKTERITARVSKKTKEQMIVLSEIMGMNESQYVNFALQNQIEADIKKFETPQNPMQ